jgi:hypothetical protein
VSDKILLTDRDVEAIYGIPRSTQAKKSDFDAWISGLRRRSTSDQGLAASAQ